MIAKLRLQRMERERAERMERARDEFRAFLRRMDHQKKREFFEFVIVHVDKAPSDLLPPWDHSESPFSLPPSDPRVVQWLAELSAMQIESDDLSDRFLHKLAREFARESR